MEESPFSLRLMIDTQRKRVLFAEASKDCVDFLFHILCLRVGTVISLLKKRGMVGSLANLYESIENLNESYMQPNQRKETLLQPARLVRGSAAPVLLLRLSNAPTKKKFYICGRGPCRLKISVSDDSRSVCPSCGWTMTTTVPYVAPPAGVQKASEEGGYVKGVATYMVMDNLEVKPMSTISSITLLKTFNVKDLDSLEEKVVKLRMREAVRLSKASLRSENVLTHVFLKSKKIELLALIGELN